MARSFVRIVNYYLHQSFNSYQNEDASFSMESFSHENLKEGVDVIEWFDKVVGIFEGLESNYHKSKLDFSITQANYFKECEMIKKFS